MSSLIVIENPKNWALRIPEAEVISARDYLTDPHFADLKRVKVYNFCRTYGYQTVGYYVSLLATARGHRPLPSVTTIQGLRQSSIVRIISEDVEELVQKDLSPVESDRFQLNIYFGRNLARRYDRLCQTIFNHFPAPFLRAEFVRVDRWRLQSLKPIATSDIPDDDCTFVIERAKKYFERPSESQAAKRRYELAILANPNEVDSPSDERAIQKFIKAARHFDIEATVIGKEDFGRLAEYDALFIRETTAVNHHTYRFATRAATEGLVVIDDPESIVRCTNKVYQAELFARYGIPSPRTMVVHRDNAKTVGRTLGYPCVLKQPDSSFSHGVVKAMDESELQEHLSGFFKKSELVVAQEYVPSTFDWRVGVLDRKPLYVCKYFMARGHWQIQKTKGDRERSYGQVETMSAVNAPERVVALALDAANLIGDSLYGVDIKEVGGNFYVMEVNDNPSVEAGYEDTVLKDDLYLLIMKSFFERLERRGTRGAVR